jgi:hypothetical protein
MSNIDWKADPDPYMRELLDTATPLTHQQRTALAELLKPVRISAADIAAQKAVDGMSDPPRQDRRPAPPQDRPSGLHKNAPHPTATSKRNHLGPRCAAKAVAE